MKRKVFSILALGFLLLAGCGMKEGKVEPPIDPQKVMKEAWALYDSLNLDAALAKFDTVLNYLPTNSEAYLGKGMTLGLLRNYSKANGFLNLGIFAEGQSGDLFAPSDTFTQWSFDSVSVNGKTMYEYGFTIPEDKRPVVFPLVDGKGSKLSIIIDTSINDTAPSETTITVDTVIKAFDISLAHFTDSIVTYRSSESGAAVPPADTAYIQYFFISYYFLRPGITYTTENPILSYAANGAAYLAEGDFKQALRNTRLSILLKDTFSFGHYPYFNQKAIALAEAYATFRMGLYRNTTEILVSLDPEWTPPEDPSDPDSYLYIIQELEHLNKTISLPF